MTQRMGEEGFRWFVGTVEDVADPLQLGRVRIRVLNEHDDPSIVTTDLLWATPIQPITSAAHQQVGTSPTGLVVGSGVFGFYLDGQEKQLPMVLGSWAKMPDGTQQTNDVPGLARGQNLLQKTQTGPEPVSPYQALYPYNKVTQTLSGHIIEIDDTPNHERLHTYHKSGTYTEIGPDGTLVTKVFGDSYEVTVKDKTLYVQGNINIVTEGGNISLTAGGGSLSINANVHITGDMTVTGTGTSTGGDFIAGGISLRHHVHADEDGTTGGPQ